MYADSCRAPLKGVVWFYPTLGLSNRVPRVHTHVRACLSAFFPQVFPQEEEGEVVAVVGQSLGGVGV